VTGLVLALWSNSIVALALGVFARLADRSGRPAVAHAVWLVALVKLVTPPLFHVDAPLVDPLVPIVARVVGSLDPPELNPVPARPVAGRAASPRLVQTRVLSETSARPYVDFPRVLLLAWMAGSAGCIVLVASRTRRFASLLRLAEPTPAWLSQEVEQLASSMGLRRVPAVKVVGARVSPMVAWLGTGVVVLPRALLDLTEARRRALIAHELAHLRRGDHLVRWGESAITAALFWNPMLWLVRWGLHEAEEQCCDAWVVRSFPDYRQSLASGLIDAAQLFGDATALPLASGLGQLAPLRRRINSIMQRKPAPSLSMRSGLFAGSVAVAMPAMPSVGCNPHALQPPASAATPASAPHLILEQFPTEAEYGEDGWFVSGGGSDVYAVRQDAAVSYDGAPAWTLIPIFGTYGKYGTWMRSIDAGPFIGKRVRVTTWTRTDYATTHVDVWGRVQASNSPGDGPGLGGQWLRLPWRSDWTKHELVFDVPDGGAWLQYGVGIAGPGSIWFSAPILETVGLDVPVTQGSSR
jgi:beta-lactamase regulating signal transducer with metallopeptidase domain